MKISSLLPSTVLIVLTISLLLFNAPAKADAPLMAAATAVDLELPDGVPLAGFGAGSRRYPFPLLNPGKYSHFFKAAKGQRDPIRGKVLILKKGDVKLLWIGVDLVAAPPMLIDYLAERTAELGFTRDNILVSASHTHSGPGAFAESKLWALIAVDKFNRTLFNHMADRILEGVRQSDRALAPAQIATADLRIEGVTNNRRKLPLLDPVATILRLDTADGQPLATVFNFPIHGTVQGTKNQYLSSDVSGAIERSIEEQTGSVGFFLNGAEGDVSPQADGVGEAWERAQILGKKIADAIVIKRATMTVGPARALTHVSNEIKLPRAKINLGTCARKHGIGHIKLPLSPWLPKRATFHGVLIDDTAFVTIAGEPITEMGLAMKQFGHSLGFNRVGVVGLTNDHLGYILTPDEFRRGGSESCASLYGENLGTLVQAAAEKTLTDLKNAH